MFIIIFFCFLTDLISWMTSTVKTLKCQSLTIYSTNVFSFRNKGNCRGIEKLRFIILPELFILQLSSNRFGQESEIIIFGIDEGEGGCNQFRDLGGGE
jgi:hypothetical protein